MEMEGLKFLPETEKPRADDVVLIDRLLKSVVPDAEFDGSSVSFADDKEKPSALAAEYSLSSDTLAAVRRISETPGSEDLVATIVLRPLQKILSASQKTQPVVVTKLGYYLNRIPGARKELAAMAFQKELVRIKAERKAIATKRRADEESRYASAKRAAIESRRRVDLVEDGSRLGFLFATYRAKWLATGGHADPNSFLGAPETLRKWGADADKTMRKSIDQPGSESNVQGTGLELFLGVEIEDQRWFGAEVVRVAAVDDYANSLDLAIEFPYDGELGIVPRLAIDFTTAETQSVLNHKLEKIGKGTNVNFFRSKVEKNDRGEAFEGRVEDLPMVILGVNKDVLSGVDASLRRGEKIGPDHPIKAILLRQAEIQVGLQIRTITAEIMNNALRNMPTDAPTRKAVEAYSTGFESGGGFLSNVAAIRDIVKTIPVGGMDYYLGEAATNRLRNLLAVHGHLERQLASTNERHPEVRGMAKSIRLTRTLQSAQNQPVQRKISPIGDIFLRVARLGFLGEAIRRAFEKELAHLPFRVIRLAFKRRDRRDGLVGRPFRWGYLVVRLLGHRV